MGVDLYGPPSPLWWKDMGVDRYGPPIVTDGSMPYSATVFIKVKSSESRSCKERCFDSCYWVYVQGEPKVSNSCIWWNWPAFCLGIIVYLTLCKEYLLTYFLKFGNIQLTSLLQLVTFIACMERLSVLSYTTVTDLRIWSSFLAHPVSSWSNVVVHDGLQWVEHCVINVSLQ